jgi:hypothetical protein
LKLHVGQTPGCSTILAMLSTSSLANSNSNSVDVYDYCKVLHYLDGL